MVVIFPTQVRIPASDMMSYNVFDEYCRIGFEPCELLSEHTCGLTWYQQPHSSPWAQREADFFRKKYVGVEMPSIKTNSRKVEEKIAKMSLKLIKQIS